MIRPVSSLEALLGAFLNVRPGEGRRTALLFVHLFLAASIFVLGRTVRDTLFLSRYSLSALPWMFVLYGLVSAVVAALYGRVADRLPRDRTIVGSCGIGIVTYLAAWVLVRMGQTWVYPTFYVWSEVVANLFIVQFWTLANDLHDPRSAKRLFGSIGSARVLGGMMVGLGAGVIVKALGTAQLLFVLAGMMVGVAALARVLGREPRVEGPGRPGVAGRRRASGAALLGDAYVRSLSLITLLAFTALTVGDYQFKAIARAAFTEDDLARFFSLFYAGTGLVSFLFQLFVTPRLLARWGVGSGMSVMPSLFGAASAALLFGPRLAVATIAKFADNGFQYTIHETTLQALYVPFAARTKARTRAFLDAVVKPLSYGAGGLALVLLAPRLDVHMLSLLTVPMVGLWMAAIPRARRLYLARLEASLSSRGALALEAESLLDAAGRRLLLQALEGDDRQRARLALEQLATDAEADLRAPLERLARHADAGLREVALLNLAAQRDADPRVALAALTDPVASVRLAAVETYASQDKDAAVDALKGRLDDESAVVRSATLAALLRHGGLEGTLVAARHLEALLGAEQPARRIEGADVLARLGEGAYRPLARLLADRDRDVRRAALKAAGGVPDARLVPALIEALRSSTTRQRASRALVAVGPAAVKPLLEMLSDGSASRALKLEIPRLLRRIPVPETYAGLRSRLEVSDSHLRLRMLAALARLRGNLGRGPEPLGFVRDLVRAELVEVLGNLAAWEQARPVYETPLLAQEFEFRQARAIRRMLRILELRYEREPLRLVRSYLGDARRRPNALEVLDTLLDSSLRALVMPFLDDLPAVERVKQAGAMVPPVASPTDFLVEQCRHPNPYVALLALDALARKGELAVREVAIEALEHSDPLVREGGVLALAAIAAAEAPRLLPRLCSDPDPMVARHAKSALERLAGRDAKETAMQATIEKVLFLMSAPIFERLSGEDLAPLARVAVPESFAEGETIFSEGDVGDSLFVIIQGRVAILRQGESIAELGAGESFGEMALLDAVPRSAAARALEETETLRIGSEEFYEVLHEQSEIAEGVIRVLTRRLRDTGDRLARLREAVASAPAEGGTERARSWH